MKQETSIFTAPTTHEPPKWRCFELAQIGTPAIGPSANEAWAELSRSTE